LVGLIHAAAVRFIDGGGGASLPSDFLGANPHAWNTRDRCPIAKTVSNPAANKKKQSTASSDNRNFGFINDYLVVGSVRHFH